MEYFIQAKFIRLRSRHNKYLVAGKDGVSVKQSRRHGQTREARWAVELVSDKPNTILLRSCHGKLLTASDEPFLLGWTGKRVIQTIQPDCNSSVHWEPVREEFSVKLRSPVTGKFLRANAGTPPWKDTVTVDLPEMCATHNWILWGVDLLDDDDDNLCNWPRNSKSLTPIRDNNIDCYGDSCSMGDDLTRFSGASSTSSIDSEAEEAESALYDTESVSADSFTNSTSQTHGHNKSVMELFQNAKTVRLRSHHDKFLLADDDQESVIQDRSSGSKRARWTVEYVKSVEGVTLVRLQSCYAKYLTATDDEFLLGVTGKKVKQTVPRRLDSSIEWEPIRDGMQIKLKTRYGNFLRANGGVPPWRNSITHDVPSRSHTQHWILWDVEVLEVYQKSPEPAPVPEKKVDRSESESEVEPFSFKSSTSSSRSESGKFVAPSVKNEGRVIHYNIVDDDGNIVGEGEGGRSLVFKGNVLEELTQLLEEETGLKDITVCSRNPLNGKLHPMRLALPPNHVKLHIYVVPSSSEAAAEFGPN